MRSLDELKKEAGIRAANLVQNNMTVGLGTGSTAAHMVNRLAERIQNEGLKITGVSTSWSTTLQCRALNIPLKEMGEVDTLDIVIDGADEIDDNKNLIKGRGAAHLLEKIVASMAKEYVIIADSSKKVDVLGKKFAVPLEIIPGAIGVVTKKVKALGGDLKVRMGTPGKDGPVISDSGNLIADAKFEVIENPAKLAQELEHIAGIVEHGLFVQMATHIILADSEKGIIEF